ncbi:MAG: hypothetical protein Q9207_003289 [Kuettlingeria erythrocarpa]
MTESDEHLAVTPADEETIKWTSVSFHVAVSDSTVAVMQSAILACLMFPEVVQKAQEESDRVVGTHRLPNFDDRKNLPCIDGNVKEARPWNPEEDIIYQDYFIPKGAYLLPSLWWFLHDPKDYSDPCFFAASVYITAVQMLAVFQIHKAKDTNAIGIPVTLEVVVEMVSRPRPYEFMIKPRSSRDADLLRRIDAE